MDWQYLGTVAVIVGILVGLISIYYFLRDELKNKITKLRLLSCQCIYWLEVGNLYNPVTDYILSTDETEETNTNKDSEQKNNKFKIRFFRIHEKKRMKEFLLQNQGRYINVMGKFKLKVSKVDKPTRIHQISFPDIDEMSGIRGKQKLNATIAEIYEEIIVNESKL